MIKLKPKFWFATAAHMTVLRIWEKSEVEWTGKAEIIRKGKIFLVGETHKTVCDMFIAIVLHTSVDRPL